MHFAFKAFLYEYDLCRELDLLLPYTCRKVELRTDVGNAAVFLNEAAGSVMISISSSPAQQATSYEPRNTTHMTRSAHLSDLSELDSNSVSCL